MFSLHNGHKDKTWVFQAWCISIDTNDLQLWKLNIKKKNLRHVLNTEIRRPVYYYFSMRIICFYCRPLIGIRNIFFSIIIALLKKKKMDIPNDQLHKEMMIYFYKRRFNLICDFCGSCFYEYFEVEKEDASNWLLLSVYLMKKFTVRTI